MYFKHIVLSLFLICYLAVFTFSCAPSPENASTAMLDGENYIISGFWNGITSPISLISSLLGMNIGIYDAGKPYFSYWLGYIFALYLYAIVIRFFWLAYQENKRLKL